MQRCHLGEGLILTAPVNEVRGSHWRFAKASSSLKLWPIAPDYRQLLRLWIRQRAQQDTVDDAEDGCVGANA
jgi:hypothetical protein